MLLVFDEIIEQQAAKSLLHGGAVEGPVHAYLFHGPPGVGKQKTALAFAAQLLGDRGRVERRAHPDLYVLEPLGDQIRIDEVRRLRRDLHMRPFEAERRVYIVVSAHTLNDEAADALLKDLEEPPPYAVVCLLADELGPLPPTIRSRCQLVPFSRLSEKAVHTVLAAQAPGLPAERLTALARVAGGRLDRAERLLDEDAAARREEMLAPGAGRLRRSGVPARRRRRASVVRLADAAGSEARAKADEEVRVARPARKRERAAAQARGVRGDARERARGARGADGLVPGPRRGRCRRRARRRSLRPSRDAAGRRRRPSGCAAAERSAELVREAWRWFEELNLQPKLALEALFIRLRRELAPA